MHEIYVKFFWNFFKKTFTNLFLYVLEVLYKVWVDSVEIKKIEKKLDKKRPYQRGNHRTKKKIPTIKKDSPTPKKEGSKVNLVLFVRFTCTTKDCKDWALLGKLIVDYVSA